jgi:predicted transcriptional regulator
MQKHAYLRGFLHSRARRLSTQCPQKNAGKLLIRDRRFRTGYTLGMKTAVSIPDEVFEKADRLARRAKRSRSELFSAALAEYVARHAPDEVTDAMNRVCADVGDQHDLFVAAAGRRVLENTEW